MSDLKHNDEVELTEALQTVQRLFMKLTKTKECVAFYVKYIQPIYKEFTANEPKVVRNNEQKEKKCHTKHEFFMKCNGHNCNICSDYY